MEKNIDQNRSVQRFQLILTYIHTSEQYENTQNCPPAIKCFKCCIFAVHSHCSWCMTGQLRESGQAASKAKVHKSCPQSILKKLIFAVQSVHILNLSAQILCLK